MSPDLSVKLYSNFNKNGTEGHKWGEGSRFSRPERAIDGS
jgi:hypothetical protein